MSEHSKPVVNKRCNLCGEPIAAARLEALPGVTTCIACAKKHPRKVDTSGVELSQASPINRGERIDEASHATSGTAVRPAPERTASRMAGSGQRRWADGVRRANRR